MRRLPLLLLCGLAACAGDPTTAPRDTASPTADSGAHDDLGEVVLTLRLAPAQPLADPVWGGLAAQPTDVHGTIRLVTRPRSESTGTDGTVFAALPARDLGTFPFPGEVRVHLEPGPHTVDIDLDTVDLAPHPGCVAGSSPFSGCAPAGWFGSGGVAAGATHGVVEVYASCECNG